MFLRALFVSLFAFCAFSASAQSTLDFAPCEDYQVNNQSYGDRLPATPNVVVDYGPADAVPTRWTNAYGDLQCVLYDANNNTGSLEITLTADAGFNVNLRSFDMGGYPNFDYTISSVQVIDAISNAVLFSQNNVLIQGDSTGPQHTTFSFSPALSGRSLRIRFDASNYLGASDNIGIDNIVFSQSVPTAASVSVGGRVTTAKGRGIQNVRLTLTDSYGETRTTLSNAFGYYRFADVPAGAVYIVTATSKRYVFNNPTQVLFLSEETNEINFAALP